MPTRWPTPEEGLLAGETRDVIAAAIAELPAAQRTVIALRDVEGWSSEEVCEALEISPGNQRILLHRARSRVRNAIEALLRRGRGDRLRRRNGGADRRHCDRGDGFRVMTDEPADSHADDLACVEVVEIVTDYLEGALPAAEARRLERHLETCPGCTEYLEQMRALAGSLGGLTEVSIPPEMRDGLIAAFRASRRLSLP